MKKTIYKGKILGLNLYNIKVEGRRVQREIIEHPGAAAILAFDEDGKIILVKQHRFPHGYVLEIPAGTLEKNEDPKDCAFRELHEETGYTSKKMTHLMTFYPSIGYNTEAIHCYVASRTKRTDDVQLDDDEILSVQKIEFGKLMQMIRTGKIQDAKTICAVMTYASKRRMI